MSERSRFFHYERKLKTDYDTWSCKFVEKKRVKRNLLRVIKNNKERMVYVDPLGRRSEPLPF